MALCQIARSVFFLLFFIDSPQVTRRPRRLGERGHRRGAPLSFAKELRVNYVSGKAPHRSIGGPEQAAVPPAAARVPRALPTTPSIRPYRFFFFSPSS